MYAALAAVAGLAAAVAPAPARAAPQGHAKVSPFEDVRWKGDADSPTDPEVLVGGKWYVLLAIDDIETEKILQHCKMRWPDRIEKRFEEDLVEVLAGLDHTVGATVDLKVRPVPAAGAGPDDEPDEAKPEEEILKPIGFWWNATRRESIGWWHGF